MNIRKSLLLIGLILISTFTLYINLVYSDEIPNCDSAKSESPCLTNNILKYKNDNDKIYDVLKINNDYYYVTGSGRNEKKNPIGDVTAFTEIYTEEVQTGNKVKLTLKETPTPPKSTPEPEELKKKLDDGEKIEKELEKAKEEEEDKCPPGDPEECASAKTAVLTTQTQLGEVTQEIKDMSLDAFLRMDEHTRLEILQASDNCKDPKGFFGIIGCFFKTKSSSQKHVMDKMGEQIQILDSQCRDYKDNRPNYCKDKDHYNAELISRSNEILRGLNIDCSGTDDCIRQLNDYACLSGMDADTCKINTAIAKDIAKTLDNNKKVETYPWFDFLSVLANPDPAALKAMKLFGIEANYSNIPQMLRDPIPSTICMAKIQGYLDKEVEYSGGISKYGCSTDINDDKRASYEDPNCVEVLGDIRAQRTRVTPDGKTAITYSVYMRTPTNTTIFYVIAVFYTQGGIMKNEVLTDDVQETKSTVHNSFETVELPINLEDGELDENSFYIGLIAQYEDGRIYMDLVAPIPLITDGTGYYESGSSGGFGNSAGNNAAKTSNKPSSQDLIDIGSRKIR